jgi:hypothetical protein
VVFCIIPSDFNAFIRTGIIRTSPNADVVAVDLDRRVRCRLGTAVAEIHGFKSEPIATGTTVKNKLEFSKRMPIAIWKSKFCLAFSSCRSVLSTYELMKCYFVPTFRILNIVEPVLSGDGDRKER